jgi:hypothetical protein
METPNDIRHKAVRDLRLGRIWWVMMLGWFLMTWPMFFLSYRPDGSLGSSQNPVVMVSLGVGSIMVWVSIPLGWCYVGPMVMPEVEKTRLEMDETLAHQLGQMPQVV